MANPDLRIVLLGETGVGKSASGNTILGREAFQSKLSFKSVTTTCKEVTENVFGKRVAVVDTPGIFGYEDEVRKVCQKALESSTPCLFLMVIKVDRFTEGNLNAVKVIEGILGLDGLKKSYILFTRGDALKNIEVEDFIFEDEEGTLPAVVTKGFEGKYHVFNNETGGQDQAHDLLVKSTYLTSDTASDTGNRENMRIVLLGSPGSGKSASANTILGSCRFKTSCDFDSVSEKSEAKEAVVEGRKVTVVDTPGFSDEKLSPQELYQEIMKICMECPQGLHAFVFVVKIGRMSKADAVLLKLLPMVFDANALKYTMILFTYGDELCGQSVEQKIQANSCISTFVAQCGGRYCVLDNRSKGTRRQVRDLLDKVDGIVEANDGQCYSSWMFRTASNFIEEDRSRLNNGGSKHPDVPNPNQQGLKPKTTNNGGSKHPDVPNPNQQGLKPKTPNNGSSKYPDVPNPNKRGPKPKTPNNGSSKHPDVPNPNQQGLKPKTPNNGSSKYPDVPNPNQQGLKPKTPNNGSSKYPDVPNPNQRGPKPKTPWERILCILAYFWDFIKKLFSGLLRKDDSYTAVLTSWFLS